MVFITMFPKQLTRKKGKEFIKVTIRLVIIFYIETEAKSKKMIAVKLVADKFIRHTEEYSDYTMATRSLNSYSHVSI